MTLCSLTMHKSNPTTHLSTFLNHLTIEPSSFTQTIKSPWQHAMELEMNALKKNHTWDLVPPRLRGNIVSNCWTYKIKWKPDGCINRWKARMVAKGYTQEFNFDNTDIFSHVVKPMTIHIVLSLVILWCWKLYQFNVSNAFLNGGLTENVYMVQP